MQISTSCKNDRIIAIAIWFYRSYSSLTLIRHVTPPYLMLLDNTIMTSKLRSIFVIRWWEWFNDSSRYRKVTTCTVPHSVGVCTVYALYVRYVYYRLGLCLRCTTTRTFLPIMLFQYMNSYSNIYVVVKSM